MRKVIGYMTAQKKIKAIIAEKNVPELYPRYYTDIKQESYNPEILTEKFNYAVSVTRLDKRPAIFI